MERGGRDLSGTEKEAEREKERVGRDLSETERGKAGRRSQQRLLV